MLESSNFLKKEENPEEMEQNKEITSEQLPIQPEKIFEKERKEILLKNLGISFQGEKSQELFIDPETIEKQLEISVENKIKMVQLNLTRVEEIERLKPIVENFRKNNPETNLSFHIDTPFLFEAGVIENKNRINEEIELAQSGDIITVHAIHPGSALEKRDINKDEQDTFRGLGKEQKENLTGKSAEFLAEIISQTAEQQKKLTFAVENVGQTIEEMKILLNRTRRILIMDYGFDASRAEQSIGVTLDISHILHNLKEKPEDQQINSLEEGIGELQQDIRCFHISVPGLTNIEKKGRFQNIINEFTKLYNKHNFDIPLYLESKRELEKTEEAYGLIKETIER